MKARTSTAAAWARNGRADEHGDEHGGGADLDGEEHGDDGPSDADAGDWLVLHAVRPALLPRHGHPAR